MKKLKYAHSFEVISELPGPLQPLRKLAYNFRWAWHPETRQLFREADRALWAEVEHNPVELLSRLSPERQERLVHDEVFLARLRACEESLDRYLSAPTWFDKKFREQQPDAKIAYFCAEFGLNECLPIYSGGLGVLAGDHLKAASDLGLPLVGVGLLYARGYFKQYLSPDGWQQERYPSYDFYRMPLRLVRGEDEQPIRVRVDLPDRVVTCQVWRADVGRVPLFLLDSNVLENAPNDQSITDTLYGGDEEMRLRQELILGIGGMRALEAMGIEPTVCHMNEGHSAFLIVERLRQFMERNGCDLRTARQVVVAGNVFTTHTPVPAGFDIFPAPLLQRYLANEVARIGMTFEEFIKMGQMRDEGAAQPFNMAVLAMENANYVNGVSKLHAEVSRGMFSDRWADYPTDEVPIDAITNGVHTMSWIGRRMAELLDRRIGPSWRNDPSDPEVWRLASEIPDIDLWELRDNQRGELVRFCRKRAKRDHLRRGAGRADVAITGGVLDPRILTIGFARRFATYKRATLLFTDKDRLRSLLFHPERPVQFVFSGKSHPRDDGGKRLIQEIVGFIEAEGVRSRLVFLEDYDIEVARALVQGVDVWLNNPRRPLEASGTSGMKVIPNGGLNCSILDGWWAEAYAPGLGWAIGDGSELADHGQQDWLDSGSLYALIEGEIAPRFYHRPEGGLPTTWLDMMRRSMRELGPRFSTARMVREYAARFYMPSSKAFQELRADGRARATAALEWRKRVQDAWKEVQIVSVKDDAQTSATIGGLMQVTARVRLGTLEPANVRVQAISGQVGSNRELSQTELQELTLRGEEDGQFVFEGQIRICLSGHRGYIVRVVPWNEDVRVPAELPLVRWEHGQE